LLSLDEGPLPNKALHLTGPRLAVLDVWYRLALKPGCFGQAAAAGLTAERAVR
jgi:hypothetical protein